MYVDGSACTAQQNNPTPEYVVNGTECYDSMSVSSLFTADPTYVAIVLPTGKDTHTLIIQSCNVVGLIADVR